MEKLEVEETTINITTAQKLQKELEKKIRQVKDIHFLLESIKDFKDFENIKVLKVLEDPKKGISCITLYQNEEIIVGSFDGTIERWNKETEERLAKWKYPGGAISFIAISLDGNNMFFASADHIIRKCNIKTGEHSEILDNGDVNITSFFYPLMEKN